jgi:hypothetical protein
MTQRPTFELKVHEQEETGNEETNSKIQTHNLQRNTQKKGK